MSPMLGGVGWDGVGRGGGGVICDFRSIPSTNTHV